MNDKMTLLTEELPALPNVDAQKLREVLEEDSFGKFVILSISDDKFMQAAVKWSPSEECRTFMATHQSDPWIIEYHEGTKHFQGPNLIPLDDVLETFQMYLAGDESWRTEMRWMEVRL